MSDNYGEHFSSMAVNMSNDTYSMVVSINVSGIKSTSKYMYNKKRNTDIQKALQREKPYPSLIRGCE